MDNIGEYLGIRAALAGYLNDEESYSMDTSNQNRILPNYILLPHANTKSDLQAMCDAICRNLKPDGRFIAVTIDPNISIFS